MYLEGKKAGKEVEQLMFINVVCFLSTYKYC